MGNSPFSLLLIRKRVHVSYGSCCFKIDAEFVEKQDGRFNIQKNTGEYKSGRMQNKEPRIETNINNEREHEV